MPLKPQFGKKIKDLRLKHSIGLRELGRLINVSAMHISNLEKGKVMPSPELVKRIASQLDADVDELLHLAKLIDPQIAEGIQDNPFKVPSFLRSAKNLSEEQWDQLQKQAERMSRDHLKGNSK